MINVFNGNLFDYLNPLPNDDNKVHFIIHGCNAQGRMGSGFAKELRRRYPAAYDEYIDTYEKGNNHIDVGSVIYHATLTNLIICNAVTQEFYGRDGAKYVSYDAIDTVFKELNNTASVLKNISGVEEVHFHFPKIGAGLAGGNWNVIEKIIDTRVTDATKNLYTL